MQPVPVGYTNTRWLTTPGNTVWLICVALQDWHLRYELETVPGVAEVATIGGFVRQYQVQLDPNKLLAYGHPTFDRHGSCQVTARMRSAVASWR